LQLIRRLERPRWWQRAFDGSKRLLAWTFGEISVTSAMLVGAAFFLAFFVGIVSGLIGGIVALLFVLVIMFVLIAMRDYRTGAMIALILLPLSATRLIPRELGGIKGLNPLNMVLAMSIGSLLLMLAFSNEKIRLPKLPRPFLIYVALMLFAGLHGAMSVNLIPAYYKANDVITFDGPVGYLRDVLFKPIIILIVAYLLATAVANARSGIRYLIPLFSTSILVPLVVIGFVAASGLSLSTLASSHSRNFLSALGIHANELGFMFNICFSLALFSFFYVEHAFAKLCLGGLIGILTMAIGLTFSRGAFLGYMMVLAYFLFTQRKFQMMVGVVCLVVIGAFFMPKAIVERATTGVKSGDVKDISAGRVSEIWLPLLPETMSSPLIGRGLSSVMWSNAARARTILPVGHPHSAYLGTILDFGFGGALVIIYFFRHMWQTYRKIGREHEQSIWRGYFQGAAACILLVAVQGATDDRFTPTLPQTFLWLSYGLALGVLERQRHGVVDMAKEEPKRRFGQKIGRTNQRKFERKSERKFERKFAHQRGQNREKSREQNRANPIISQTESGGTS
jgi:hypothetical protein